VDSTKKELKSRFKPYNKPTTFWTNKTRRQYQN